MSETIVVPGEPSPALVNVAHLVYALHALSLVIGITTAATIVGAFVFGVPSIIAVVINYLKEKKPEEPSSSPTFVGRSERFGFRSSGASSP